MVILVALLAAFIFMLLEKTGVRSYIILHSKVKIIAALFDCDFCLSFWIAAIISVVLALLSGNLAFVVICFMSAPLTRFLV